MIALPPYRHPHRRAGTLKSTSVFGVANSHSTRLEITIHFIPLLGWCFFGELLYMKRRGKELDPVLHNWRSDRYWRKSDERDLCAVAAEAASRGECEKLKIAVPAELSPFEVRVEVRGR